MIQEKSSCVNYKWNYIIKLLIKWLDRYQISESTSQQTENSIIPFNLLTGPKMILSSRCNDQKVKVKEETNLTNPHKSTHNK